MSTFKMTFSLASLILIFAFAAMPVMAHDVDTAAEGTQHVASGPALDDAAHSAQHMSAPTVESIKLVDLMTADGSTVNGNNVLLVADPAADPIVAAVTDGTVTGRFQVKITFSGDVHDTLAGGTFDDGDIVVATGLTITAASQSASGVDVAAGLTPISIAREDVGDPAENSGNSFIVDFTVTAATIQTDSADADTNMLPIDVWVMVNAGVVTSATGLVDGVTTYGTGNMASTREKFTIVSMLPTVVTNMVKIAIPDDAGPAAKFTATLTFTEAVDMLAASQVMVTGGVAGTPAKDTTTTDGTVWTVEITPVVGATQVTVDVSEMLAMGDPASTMETDTTPTGDDAFAAESYLVVVRDLDNPPNFGTANPTLIEWSAMPDLERLFDIGGSINVKVEGATRLQVVFSEVMWAVDEGKVGEMSYTGGQWIELYNRTSGDNAKTFSIADITFTAKEGRPALAEETDRISNVVSGGEDWVLSRGQNGNSGAADGTGMVEFISMYRNNYGEPGHQSSRWTTSTELYAKNHRGTPGQKERSNVPTIGTTNANRGPVIFNEISNNATAKYEWIELRNVSDGEQNLKNWEISIITSKGAPPQDGHTAEEFIQFPGSDRKVPAGGILLVLATDPRNDDDHPIQTGWDITRGAGDQINGVNADSPRYIVLPFRDGGLPDDGNFVLVLRNRNDRTSSNADNNTRDIAGYVPGDGLKVDNDKLFTNLWPLTNFPAAKWSNNNLVAGAVHRRQFADIDGTKSKDKNQTDKTAFRDVGWTGIGYRRNATANAQNGGTPGYPNNALQSNETQASADLVIISEIMYATGNRANIPQWIELRNLSNTVGINLDGWRLTIVNHDQDMDGNTYAGDLSKNYDISGRIPPGQTFLLVAYTARNETNLPSERIKMLGSKRGDVVMNQYAFELTLLTRGKDAKDANRKVADKVGNLATVSAADARVRRNPQSYEDPAWALPMGTNDDGDRISIVRVSGMDGPINGQVPAAWSLFDMSGQFASTLDPTSYGHATDLSNPGHTVGGVLPVSLSKFRPERLKDTGQVVIRWITESELNNAGFNILRSDTRDSEFTRINTKLIAGQGTTSERTVYEYADTSAKPNVVYYYQIQDVSLDGQVTTLRTTHLRGNVTAAGKLTTTWGELKALQ